MSELTIGRLKELLSGLADEDLILAIGLSKENELKLLTCPADTSQIQKSMALQSNVKWMQRI